MQSICKTLSVAVIFFSSLVVLAADRKSPNVLIIMADDCTYNDLSLYGGKTAQTPHINQLAAGGLVFDRAYLCEAMCQPCRSELFTGKYPVANGSAYNHSSSRAGVRSLPQYLEPYGYRVGISGKIHVKPKSVFPFEIVDGFEKSCVKNPTKTHSLDGIKEFMGRNSRDPFCLVVALVDPHVPWVMGDPSAYPPAAIELPENIADTPETRTCFSRYLAEITYMDSQVGDILGVLDATGKRDETLVFFTSEQGSQFPGNKWTNWNTGVHTALIASWPGMIKPGRTDALVQYADVVPTLLDVNGESESSIQKKCDGMSFLPSLKDSKPSKRKYVYGLHNNYPEGPPYPIRSISDGTYRLVLNLRHQNAYVEKHLMGMTERDQIERKYWSTWMRDCWQDDRTYRLINRYTTRPAVTFYNAVDDPYEMENLAGQPEYKEIVQQLQDALQAWMQSQGDPGAAMDTREVYEAAKSGRHQFPE
jgi:uncharacterized sulfatase